MGVEPDDLIATLFSRLSLGQQASGVVAARLGGTRPPGRGAAEVF